MTERGNILSVYRQEKPEWTPIYMEAIYLVGIWANNETGLRGERVREDVGLDVFGVEWNLGHGAPVPVPNKYLLEDICDWRTIQFPKPKTWDWESMAAQELKDYDDSKALNYFCEQGCFDRLTQLMGFENALMSLVMEPEECSAFFSAVADYKVELIQCVAKYYKPDIFTYTDDVAKVDSLFMKPDTYRELIKPHHARIVAAIREHGMFAEQHTCGKCEAIIDDYVEMGIQSWFPAQPSNDLVGIQKKHGDKLVINGGFDSQGPAGYPDASAEIMQEEARRMANTYAVNGSYICLPMIGSLGVEPTEMQMMQIGAFMQEFRKECIKLGI
jgi:hypothetical protein